MSTTTNQQHFEHSILTPLSPHYSFLPDDLLTITIKKATQLENKDTFGKSDPFVKILLLNNNNNKTNNNNNKQQVVLIGQTKVIQDNLNPIWNESFDFIFNNQIINNTGCNEIKFEVYDYDNITSHDLIGSAIIKINKINEIKNEILIINEKLKTTLEIEYLLQRIDPFLQKNEPIEKLNNFKLHEISNVNLFLPKSWDIIHDVSQLTSDVSHLFQHDNHTTNNTNNNTNQFIYFTTDRGELDDKDIQISISEHVGIQIVQLPSTVKTQTSTNHSELLFKIINDKYQEMNDIHSTTNIIFEELYKNNLSRIFETEKEIIYYRSILKKKDNLMTWRYFFIYDNEHLDYLIILRFITEHSMLDMNHSVFLSENGVSGCENEKKRVNAVGVHALVERSVTLKQMVQAISNLQILN
ncbi:hypothetical protein ABK040_006377 [Willaertia magna]